MSVSDLGVCNLAFEGNLTKLKDEIGEKKDLLQTKDQVMIIKIFPTGRVENCANESCDSLYITRHIY